MNNGELQEVYDKAYKVGKQAWHQKVLKGEVGYLTALERLIQNNDIVAELPLGIIEIPINKIIGTYTHSRSVSFAYNFMPIMPSGTEFATKWMQLYGYHIDKGITDPIKVYEYLNRFFVIEGNKRVSVLKFLEGTTINGQVIRLVPKHDPEDKMNCIYYEFMNFYKETHINTIWFSEEGRFTELLQYMNKYKRIVNNNPESYKLFLSNLYRPFRKIYLEQGGEDLEITTGDAFLIFLQIYGLELEITEETHRNNIKSLISELEVVASDETNVKMDSIQTSKRRGMLTSLTDLVISKKALKVAFVYAKTAETSGWAYAHELGRLHIDNIFKDQIITTKIQNVPENGEAYNIFKAFGQEGYDLVFTTSPTFVAPTLKAAMEFPGTRFFNCAATHSYKSLTLYYGRIHEPRYILGMIAGSMTQTNKIGYVAPYPISEVLSSVNAFALGAQAVNPLVKVKTVWTHCWDNPEESQLAAKKLLEEGIDIISNEDLPIPGDQSKEYGVYKINSTTGEKTHYAMAIWNWGIFYEKVIQNILNGTWKNIYEHSGNTDQPVNFWQGMNNGVVDLLYSNRNIHSPMKHLIEGIKKLIVGNEFDVFRGPIYDQNHQLRVKSQSSLDYEEIVHMDWLVAGVEGSIPDIKTLTPTDPFSYMKGL